MLTAWRCYRNPVQVMRALLKLIAMRKQVQGGHALRRCIKVNGRYFLGLNMPGWPSPAFTSFIERELNKIYPFRPQTENLQTLIFAVTSRCPLACEHCFESNRLQDRETLTLKDLLAINHLFQKQGISQIQISGGEPLVRLDDVLILLEEAAGETDYWLLTSGYRLTPTTAARLHAAGLAGVNISLDHWDREAHNVFRGHPQAFDWAVQAAAGTVEAGMALCLSICATRDFVTQENLWKYLHFAADLGAGFIQILEPRQAGAFLGEEIELPDLQQQLLTDFFLEVNSGHHYRNMPLVMYPGYHQRLLGCFGAGERYLYVDSEGDLHACPFCQDKQGNCLTEPLSEVIGRIRENGCHQFEIAPAEF